MDPNGQCVLTVTRVLLDYLYELGDWRCILHEIDVVSQTSLYVTESTRATLRLLEPRPRVWGTGMTPVDRLACAEQCLQRVILGLRKGSITAPMTDEVALTVRTIRARFPTV